MPYHSAYAKYALAGGAGFFFLGLIFKKKYNKGLAENFRNWIRKEIIADTFVLILKIQIMVTRHSSSSTYNLVQTRCTV